jgi:hypothetical protein
MRAHSGGARLQVNGLEVHLAFREPIVAATSHLASLSLGALACCILAGQLLIGFPVEREIRANLAQQRERVDARPAAQIGMHLASTIEVRRSAWVWLSLLVTAASVPAFVVEAGILAAGAVRKLASFNLN